MEEMDEPRFRAARLRDSAQFSSEFVSAPTDSRAMHYSAMRFSAMTEKWYALHENHSVGAETS